MAKQIKRQDPVNTLFLRYEKEPAHATQVRRLTLQLFDGLTELHGFGDRERQWLEAAALLHDIGWSQGPKAHHKNSMKLILKHRFDGWTEEEQLIVANIARYHRKSAPKLSHKNYAALPTAARQIVLQLAAILRIADGLDRSHGNVVEKIDCKIDPDRLSLTLVCHRDIHSELYGFEKKRHLFEKAFGLPVVINNIKNSWDN